MIDIQVLFTYFLGQLDEPAEGHLGDDDKAGNKKDEGEVEGAKPSPTTNKTEVGKDTDKGSEVRHSKMSVPFYSVVC